jgi:hypothetical protein
MMKKTWMGCAVLTTSITLTGCPDSMIKTEEAISVRLSFQDERQSDSDGYQRIIAYSGKDDEKFCADSFAAAFTRNLISVGNESALTLVMDNKQILLFSYDNKTRTCKKENTQGNIIDGFKRKDIAADEAHSIKLAFVDANQIGTVKRILLLAEKGAAIAGQPFLAAAAKQPTSEIAGMLDEVLSKSASYKDERTTSFPLPNGNNYNLQIQATIAELPYNLAQVSLEEKESLFDGMSAKAVMTKKLLANETPAAVLDRLRNGESPASVVGNLSAVSRECTALRRTYQDSLTGHDMQYLLESYLISTNVSHVGPQYLDACLGSTDESVLVTSELKDSMEKLWKSPISNRGFRFMEDFTAYATYPSISADVRLEYPPQGFAYKTAGELLSSSNQGPARCYRFSEQEARIFYFVKAVDGLPFYFTGHVDQAYSKVEEEEGKRSRILRLEVYKDVWAVGGGEYSSKDQRCVNLYETAFRK